MKGEVQNVPDTELLAFLHVDVLNNPEVSEPYSLGTEASSGKCNHEQ